LNMTETIEGATKEYGTSILMSESISYCRRKPCLDAAKLML